MQLLIYLIGFLATYISIKVMRNKGQHNDWDDVIFTIGFSLTSWVGFIISIIFHLVGASNSGKIKPPKWL